MTPASPEPQFFSLPPRKPAGLRRWLLGIILVVVGAMIGWWVLRLPGVLPPLPSGIEDEEVQQALEKARQKVLDEPHAAASWGWYGKVLLAHLFDRDADFCFAQAARLDPADPQWLYGRSLIALKREPEMALPLLRQALTPSASWPAYRAVVALQLAEAIMERGQIEEAEELFRQEEKADANNARAALGLGLIARIRGQEAMATKHLTLARASTYARKKAAVQLAILARTAGNKEAADTLEQEVAALADDPPWPDPLLDEVIFLQVGRRGRERQVARLEQQHRYAEAAQVYLKQLKGQPTTEDYIGAGINLARMREYEQATTFLREAVQREPENAHALFSYALALFSRAERAWHDSPGSPQAKEWFQETVQHARRATERRPDHARAYLFWGLALKYLGDPQAAETPLRKGIACAPADFELQFGLGEVLLQRGQTKEAQSYLENARRLSPKDPRLVQALQRVQKEKR